MSTKPIDAPTLAGINWGIDLIRRGVENNDIALPPNLSVEDYIKQQMKHYSPEAIEYAIKRLSYVEPKTKPAVEIEGKITNEIQLVPDKAVEVKMTDVFQKQEPIEAKRFMAKRKA